MGRTDARYAASMSAVRHSVSPFDAVVVVGSQGARDAFEQAVHQLPPALPAAIVFDLHRSDSGGLTERLLGARLPLPVRVATDGLALDNATVYLAPAVQTVRFGHDGTLSVAARDDLPQRWLGDELLVSAAETFGPRTIAVVLSGRLSCGARGAVAVKRAGGRVLVQDPATAQAPGMPTAALATGCADFALSPPALGQALAVLCAAPGGAELFRVRLNAGVQG